MPLVCGGSAYRAVISGVLVRRLGVVGPTESAVPDIQARYFVAAVASPARSPEDGSRYRGRHNFSVVPSHIRRWLATVRDFRLGIGAARPVDAQDCWFLL